MDQLLSSRLIGKVKIHMDNQKLRLKLGELRKSDCELRFPLRAAIRNKRIFWATTTGPMRHEKNIHNVGSANEAISIG